MLTANDLGLPSLLQADNSTHSAKEIFHWFKTSGPAVQSIVVKNCKDFQEFLKLFRGEMYWSVYEVKSKGLAFLNKTRASEPYGELTNEVKRKINLTFSKVELGKTLLVTGCQYGQGIYSLKKGISNEQFDKQINLDRYDCLALQVTDYVVSLLKPHMRRKGFDRVSSLVVPGLRYSWKNRTIVYMKG